MNTNKIANAVMVALVSAGVATSAANAASNNKKVEKCYGISKAKKNDCGTSKHACAGQARMNSSPTEWIYVLKGNCNRIVGASLSPQDSGTKK